MKLKRMPGTVDPSEYNWEEQFAEALCHPKNVDPYVAMDKGKVLGLALAYKELKELKEQ